MASVVVSAIAPRFEPQGARGINARAAALPGGVLELPDGIPPPPEPSGSPTSASDCQSIWQSVSVPPPQEDQGNKRKAGAEQGKRPGLGNRR